MRGGIHQIIWEDRARCFDGVVFFAILIAIILPTACPCQADQDSDEHCRKKNPLEQSIVISKDKAAPGGSMIAVATDQQDDSLEPVANVSEYVPDLAEERVAGGPDRDLANPGAPNMTEAEAVAEDGVDEPTDFAQGESQVINFEGVTPGITHRRDVFRAWGDPRSEKTTSDMLRYRFDRFQSVDVSFDGDIVDAIVVRLDNPLPLRALMSRLSLEAILPAALTSDQGVVLVHAFPERGVVLRFSEEQSDVDESDVQSGLRVAEIVIQPIKSAAFVLRAENELSLHPSQSLRDLDVALQLDPTSAHARWLLAEIEMKRGKAVAAERYAAEAAELEPTNLAFRLQWARCLRQLAHYDKAVEQTHAILHSPSIDPMLRAEALYEMGMLAALGSQEVAKSAVPLHQKAMEIADRLAGGDDPQVGRAANKLLVETHLATAIEIARGQWDNQMETVPKWIRRASALAEGIIAEDDSQLHFRLQVAVSALATAASLDEPIDPNLWIEEAEQTAKLLRKMTDDPISRDQIDWNLGLAYFQATQIEHSRSEPESALRFGNLADAKLFDLAKERDELPDAAYVMGRLYFQIGAVYAVHENDHATACEWYDQAADRLLNPVPVTTMANPQQHGDALVSMGVSYWENGDRDRAVEITRAGVQLIEQAVSTGLLQGEALLIPYGNLAAMYQAQGEAEPAAKYTGLAQKISGTQR